MPVAGANWLVVTEAVDRGLQVPLAGASSHWPGLETALDVDELSLRQVRAAGHYGQPLAVPS